MPIKLIRLATFLGIIVLSTPLNAFATEAMIANGEVCAMVDEFGNMLEPLYRQSWRTPLPQQVLLPFGQLVATNGSERSLAHELNPSNGFSRSYYTIPNRYRVETTVYAPLNEPTVVFERKLMPETSEEQTFVETFTLPTHPRIVGVRTNNTFCFTSFGQEVRQGTLHIISSAGKHYTPSNITLTTTFSKPTTIRTILSFSSTNDAPHLSFVAHQRAWQEIFDTCHFSTPDAALNAMVAHAIYNIRAVAGDHSIPIGIRPLMWSGRYFGYDEMFPAQAMAAIGLTNICRQVVDFRYKTLPQAQARVGYYCRSGKYGARYVWESDENGDYEGAPLGFWIDHIFGGANIARTAWTHYLYTGDIDYLKTKGFPIILNTALYYYNACLQRDQKGRLTIGRVCDFERLGPSREHPLMTLLAVADNFKLAVRAAEIVGRQSEVEGFDQAANDILKSLPCRNNTLVADENSDQLSISLIGGLSCYPVLSPNDHRQSSALTVVTNNLVAIGNMYPYGKAVCSWYAGLIADALMRAGDPDQAYKLLKDASQHRGPLGEIYEIYEPPQHISRSYFTTGAGSLLYATIRAIVALEDDGTIYIGRGIPKAWDGLPWHCKLPIGRDTLEIRGIGRTIAYLSTSARQNLIRFAPYISYQPQAH